jgi:uncharacterized surface anchored protein
MGLVELEIVRNESSELVQALPDGSTAIFEVPTKNVYSLNPSAAAAWAACASPTTLSQLAAAMSQRLNAPVTEDLAQEAVSELAAVGLVSVTPAERLGTSRRALLKQVAEVAIPVVLALTAAEQRAYAQGAGSAPTTSPVTTSPSPPLPTTGDVTTTLLPPGTTRRPASLGLVKGVGLEVPTPLAGAEFDLRDSSGRLVAHLITDASGRAQVSNLAP